MAADADIKKKDEDAKTARETRDVGAVGDRCFVTFRYAADAMACLQAFAPSPCGSPCCEKDDKENLSHRQLRVTRAPEVENIRWENLSDKLPDWLTCHERCSDATLLRWWRASWRSVTAVLTTALSLLVLYCSFMLIVEFTQNKLTLQHHGALEAGGDGWLDATVSKAPPIPPPAPDVLMH